MGNQPSRPPPPPLPEPPPLPPLPKVLLEDGDALIPAPMLATERKKLLAELASAIDDLFTLQDEIPGKIEANESIVKLQIIEIKRIAMKDTRYKNTQLQVIYSDIQESGDDDCELIQEDIDNMNKQIRHIKAIKPIDNPTLQETLQELKLSSDLSELEYNLEKLKESLNSRKKKTSSLLIAAEVKGDDELGEIADTEKYDINRVKKKQTAYVKSLLEDFTDEISKTIKNFEKKGVYIPPIILCKFNTMVIPVLLIQNGIRSY